MRMTSLRLLADDLTGALDTAAELVGLVGPVPVFWHGAIPAVVPASAALDSGTRELGPLAAAKIVAGLTGNLSTASIAYKKIDSLLRGPTVAELAACVRAGGWPCCVLAPAFPHQGRVTQGGRQFARDGDGRWSSVGGDIVAMLRAEGVEAQVGRLDAGLLPGISVFDAETDDDLRRVVATGQRWAGPLLWSGSGGLAQALAAGAEAPALGGVPSPVLGLFGSDQAATADQLAACAPYRVALPAGEKEVARRLAADGVALASVALPPGMGREEAARCIAAELANVVRGMGRPGTLLAAGGETLRGLCMALGAHSLEAQGRIAPGVPWSVLRGGRWDGVVVVSKSGGFGGRSLLRELILERTA